MKKRILATMLQTAFIFPAASVLADEAGTGRPYDDPNAAPGEPTSSGATETSLMDQLTEWFDIDVESSGN